jgi:diacylglycerol kinase family enzyme
MQRNVILATELAGGLPREKQEEFLYKPAQILQAPVEILGHISPDDLKEHLRDLTRSGLTPIVTGGDGWFSYIINALPAGATVGYFPMGTGMAALHELHDIDFKDTLALTYPTGVGKHFSPHEKFERIAIEIANGSPKSIDLVVSEEFETKGLIGSVGIDAEIIERKCKLKDEGKSTPWAYLKGGLQAFRNFGKIEATITVDGKTHEVDDLLSILVMKFRFNGYGLHACPEAQLDGGDMYVRAVSGPKWRTGVKVMYSSIFSENSQGIRLQGKQVEIDSSEPLSVQMYGDKVGSSSKTSFYSDVGGLKLIIPQT